MNNLLEYYKKMPLPVKASLWFTISSVIQKGISLLTTPIFTRLLTTDQYGVYSVYQSWYSIIVVFATLNLYAGVYNNGLTKWTELRNVYTSCLLSLSTICTCITFLIYLIAASFWNGLFGLSTVFVLAIFAQALFEPAFCFWSTGQRYDYNYKKLIVISIGMGLASPILGIVSVLSAKVYKAEARVLSFVFVQVIVGLVFYIYIMWRGRILYFKEFWRFALAFSLPLIPHYLSMNVLNQADRIMISKMVGNSEAAIYSVAYSFSMMFTIVTAAINNSFIPYTYKAMKDDQYEKLKKNANFLMLSIALTCMVAMAFGPEIIRVFAAPPYYEAKWVIPPVACALFFMFVYPLFCNVEFYFEQTKFIMIASSIAALTNIALNYIGIQLFGYLAAAYTTLICYILLVIAHYIAHKIVCRDKGIDFEIYDTRVILLLSLASVIVMIIMTLTYERIIIRYSMIAMIALLAVIKRKAIKEKIKEIRA